jgi:hypothetical protein
MDYRTTLYFIKKKKNLNYKSFMITGGKGLSVPNEL